MKNTFYLFYILFIFVSCSQENTIYQDKITSSPISFTSVVENNLPTRVIENTWETDDCIGVYMKQSGGVLSSQYIVSEILNTPFSTSNTLGNFIPVGNAVYFPNDKSKVDFIAYYPYKPLDISFVYPIDLTDQGNPSKIDILYADNLMNIAAQSNALNLHFSHQLGRIKIKTSLPNVASHDLLISISNVYTQGSLHLNDGNVTPTTSSIGVITTKTTINGNQAESQALLLPSDLPQIVKIKVVYNGKSYSSDLTISKIEKGKQYLYNIDLGGGEQPPITPTLYQSWKETPLITPEMLANNDLMYVVHDMPNSMKDPVSGKTLRNYSMLYSKDLKIAYWVAYPLFKECLSGVSRTNAWAYDPSIPMVNQADLSSGFGTIYDRGHQIPSADRLSDAATNQTTFYYSNMTPQIGATMNQTIWADLENAVRGWVADTDTLFVVTGAIPPSTNIERVKTMAVPEYYFKAIACKKKGDTNYSSIAFKIDNISYSHRRFMDYVISVSTLEQQTGFVFFPSLDSGSKLNVDLNKW